MSKIKDAFTKGKAFIPFISAGDHGIEEYRTLYSRHGESRRRHGRNWYSILRPNSGRPSNSRSEYTCIIYRRKIHDIFDMVRRLRSGDDAVTVPLVFMTYLNPIYVFGRENSLPSAKRLVSLVLSCQICRLKKRGTR